MQELQSAFQESKRNTPEDIPGTNAQLLEDVGDIGGDPTMQDANWQHQVRLIIHNKLLG